MSKDAQMLEDYIVTMSNTVVLGKQWEPQGSLTPANLTRPSGLLMYTDRGEVPITNYYYYYYYHPYLYFATIKYIR